MKKYVKAYSETYNKLGELSKDIDNIYKQITNVDLDIRDLISDTDTPYYSIEETDISYVTDGLNELHHKLFDSLHDIQSIRNKLVHDMVDRMDS